MVSVETSDVRQTVDTFKSDSCCSNKLLPYDSFAEAKVLMQNIWIDFDPHLKVGISMCFATELMLLL